MAFPIILALALAPLALAEMERDGGTAVISPDGNISAEFATRFPGGDASPCYRVLWHGQVIIDYSPLGLTLRGDRHRSLDRGWTITRTETSRFDEVWTFPLGKSSRIRNHYNELTVHLRESAEPHRELGVIFRAYDDGVAFRYSIPTQSGLTGVVITEERSGFAFTGNHRVYAQKVFSYHNSYQHTYSPMRLQDIRLSNLVALPLLVEIENGPWVALTEADLTDYAGMYLSAHAAGENLLRCRLAPDIREPDVKVTGTPPLITPWRVVMIGDGMGDLIESNIILNLNDPCVIGDTSWIKPGKAVWPWWSGNAVEGVPFKGGMNTETILHYLDFAEEAGLEYIVVDAGWYSLLGGDITKPIKAVDLPRILAYARERGIGVILWLDWARAAKQMNKAFSLYERWGIAGVKIDYLHRDDQAMMQFYHTVLRKAAEHRLVVDFHGVHKPAGIRRTYPNLLTQEGVRGLEFNKWSRWSDPEHHVMLAFTRMLAGEMDFTPGGFRNVPRDEFRPSYHKPMVMGTRSHHLAMYVVYESPLQMVSDFPAAYRGEAGLDFLKAVPTVWDETVVVSADIGNVIVIARRKDRDWYVGGMTDWTSREVSIPLHFLGVGQFRAQIYTDGVDVEQNPRSVRVTSDNVDAGSVVRARLASGGGFAIRIVPAD